MPSSRPQKHRQRQLEQRRERAEQTTTAAAAAAPVVRLERHEFHQQKRSQARPSRGRPQL